MRLSVSWREDEDENEDKVASQLLRLAILRHSRLAHVTVQSSLYLGPALHLSHLHARYSGASIHSYHNLHYLSYPLARTFVSEVANKVYMEEQGIESGIISVKS